MKDLEIRICHSWDDCLQCEELQYQVWELDDYHDVVPAHLIITAIKNGGILAGAFEDGRMVGFAFGFLGFDKDGEKRQLKHTSHMLAVLPEVRAHGVGAKLKWAQRAEAQRQGLSLMTWTYDPLQAVNAHLNLARLGAIARRYYRDAYGEMLDGLNVGVASDRFEVEWFLNSPRTAELAKERHAPMDYAGAHRVYSVEWTEAGLPQIGQEDELEGEMLLVEVPANIGALKAQNLPLAVEWRQRTRDTFEKAFAAGYVACDVWRKDKGGSAPRVWYVLKRETNFQNEV